MSHNVSVGNNLKSYIQDFLDYLEIEKNRSPKTLRNYDHYLRRFLEFANSAGQQNPSPAHITLPLVRRYRLYLNRTTDSDGRSLKLVTQNYHIIALRSFLRFCGKRDIATISPEKVELPKMVTPTVSFLAADEVTRLIDSIPTQGVSGKRDRAIIECLYSTGLRVSELVSLDRARVNLNTREITVRGKGRKERLVFLDDASAHALTDYLTARTDDEGRALLAALGMPFAKKK